jgi:membrane protease subunit HflK
MSLNDPQWGKRGGGGGSGGGNGGGPPDLDEIWRNVNRRVNELFGRRGSRGEQPSGGRPRLQLPLGGVGMIIGLVILVWLASGFYIVDEGRRGVVTRFGRYVEMTMPGPRWHLPYPVEAVEIVNLTQVRTLEFGYRSNVKSKVLRESLMLTDDENIVDIQFAVQYILKDPADFVFNNRDSREAQHTLEETVRQVSESVMREVVGKSKMDGVLYEGRGQIAADAQTLTQNILDRYRTGIQISRVTMQNAQPPEQVQAAFDDAVKAGQDRERARNEGQAYANDVIPRARGAESRLIEEANGYLAAVVSKAEGDGSRFSQLLSEYDKSPGVTRERLYLDMMQSVLGSSSKVLVDQKAGQSLLYLPLDKLIQQASATSTEPPRTAPPEPAPSVEPAQRGREALRNRDLREAR